MEFKKSTKGRKQAATPASLSELPQAPPTPAHSAEPKSITINIHLDAVTKLLKQLKRSVGSRLKQLTNIQKRVGLGCLLFVTTLLIIGSYFHQRNVIENSEKASQTSGIVENLEYQTVLPDGKTITDLGGWKRVSPPESEPVFAYTDTLENVTISVSQQPLPPSFTGSIDDHIAELAKKFNATTRVDSDGTPLYIGTSAQGPQSVILSKNTLLILIKSQGKIDTAAWQKYTKSLN